MRPVFTVKPFLIALFLISLNLNACVQPYSSKAFYKNDKAKGDAPSNANESAQSLTIQDIRTMLNTPGLTEYDLARSLQKMNKNWRIKGFDAKTGEKYYVNFGSKDNQEALVWHVPQNTAEYVTNNTNHYKSIIDNLNTTGYKVISGNPQDGQTYSNGKNKVSVSQTLLYNNSRGYRIIFN